LLEISLIVFLLQQVFHIQAKRYDALFTNSYLYSIG
jgi:hypothetical protein